MANSHAKSASSADASRSLFICSPSDSNRRPPSVLSVRVDNNIQLTKNGSYATAAVPDPQFAEGSNTAQPKASDVLIQSSESLCVLSHEVSFKNDHLEVQHHIYDNHRISYRDKMLNIPKALYFMETKIMTKISSMNRARKRKVDSSVRDSIAVTKSQCRLSTSVDRISEENRLTFSQSGNQKILRGGADES